MFKDAPAGRVCSPIWWICAGRLKISQVCMLVHLSGSDWMYTGQIFLRSCGSGLNQSAVRVREKWPCSGQLQLYRWQIWRHDGYTVWKTYVSVNQLVSTCLYSMRSGWTSKQGVTRLTIQSLWYRLLLGTEQVVSSIPGSVGYIFHVHWAYDYLGPFGVLWVYIWLDTKIVFKIIINCPSLNLSFGPPPLFLDLLFFGAPLLDQSVTYHPRWKHGTSPNLPCKLPCIFKKISHIYLSKNCLIFYKCVHVYTARRK